MKTFFSLLICAAFAAPALASVTVSSPSKGETVGSPFTLSANAGWCSGQWISGIGYSLDNSSSTTVWHNNVINTKVSASTGSHTIHVKSWGHSGSLCVTDVSINVTSSAPSALYISSGASTNSSLQMLGSWVGGRDSAGGSGAASGYTTLVGSPLRSGGGTRAFVSKFTSNGSMRYHVSFGDDAQATHFVYDTWLYLTGSATSIANIEMDMNQTMSNGQTVIYGFQCDGWKNRWDYTVNAGTPQYPKDQWRQTSIYCNPRAWTRYKWHHIQIEYSRSSTGHVTYSAVTFDGVRHSINVTALSAFAMGWGPTLLTNFQIDGYGSGTNTVYMSDLKVSRW
ncbi:MAG: hypothetical protein ACRD3F_16890 [Acidobacteriaceae bacterium]